MAVRNVEYIIGLRDKFSSKMGNIQARTQALDGTMLRLRSTIGTLFTAFAAQRVISDIIKVGSNFEQLQISFETMLGSAEKATKLIKDLTKFAIETPFELKDVSQGAKALLAFGIANEKILPTLKSLGDVAAGLSVPIERLILNFGQVKAQTILTGRELRDFAIAGVPLLGELAKIMGKTTAEVKTLVSTGDVGFEVVELAFRNMSEEGGKFFDLMKKQTASTGGQISNLRDVIALLENDLFKKFQPAINNTVVAIQRWTAFFRENIDTIVEIISIIGQFIKLLLIYKALQLSVNLVIRGAIAANRLYRLSLVLLNKGFVSSIRLMKGFKLALARTGIGIALVAISELIIQFSGLEDSILRANDALGDINNTGKKLFQQLIIGRDIPGRENLKLLRDNIEKLANSELDSLKAFLEEKEGSLRRTISNLEEGRPERKLFQEDLQDVINAMELINAELAKFKQGARVGVPGIGGVNLERVGITKITSAAPKIFNINIENLVETINNNVTNLPQAMGKSKEIITEALLTALSDVQIQTR